MLLVMDCWLLEILCGLFKTPCQCLEEALSVACPHSSISALFKQTLVWLAVLGRCLEQLLGIKSCPVCGPLQLALPRVHTARLDSAALRLLLVQFYSSSCIPVRLYHQPKENTSEKFILP